MHFAEILRANLMQCTKRCEGATASKAIEKIDRVVKI